MARKRIQGITIELDGETTGLEKALKDVNKRSYELQDELRDVDRLLKFDPGNVEALAQKQRLLTEQVENTAQKLDQLRKAEQQVQQQFERGEITEQQYRSFRREIEFTETELKKFQKRLNELDDVKSLDNLEKDFKEVKKEADKTKDAIKDVGSELSGVIGGLAAGGGIAGVVSQALDLSSLDTKIEISMDIPPESVETVKSTIRSVTSVIGDQGEALEGVRRQWALNADASDEANARIVGSASAIAAAFSGIDFIELIQETNEISRELNISNEEALALTNALLTIGFPPEQLDIIAEYGKQLTDAGYTAEEVQAIMAAGVDTGTWNIDNLLDGLKEGRIRMVEFGSEVPKAMEELLEKTSISSEQMKTWGQAVAEGGERGNKAMQEVAFALNSTYDETTRNALGVQIFGTMWEDQGTNIIDTILNMNEHISTTEENQDRLNQTIEAINADPAIQMRQALADLKEALEPLLSTISEIISKFAEWARDNPTLTASILAIVTGLGILMGIVLALSPIVTALATAVGAFGIGLLPLVGIVAGVIAAITALIAVGVLLYKNWDKIKEFAANLWKNVSQSFENMKNAVSEKMSAVWQSIKDRWDAIMDFFKGINLMDIGKDIIQGLINGIQDKWNALKDKMRDIGESIKDTIANVLGIRSPSRVMIGFGENVGEGMAIGIQRASSMVQEMSQRMANMAVPDVSGLSAQAVNNSTTNNQVSNVFHVTVQADDLRQVGDVIDLFNNLRQTARQGV